MENREIIYKTICYLNQCGLRLEVYERIDRIEGSGTCYILEGSGVLTKYNSAKELKEALAELQNNVIDMDEQEARKRRQIRNLLKEASEEIAKKYNKQVFTISLGDNE